MKGTEVAKDNVKGSGGSGTGGGKPPRGSTGSGSTGSGGKSPDTTRRGGAGTRPNR